MSKCFPRRQLSDALGVRMGCHILPKFGFKQPNIVSVHMDMLLSKTHSWFNSLTIKMSQNMQFLTWWRTYPTWFLKTVFTKMFVPPYSDSFKLAVAAQFSTELTANEITFRMTALSFTRD